MQTPGRVPPTCPLHADTPFSVILLVLLSEPPVGAVFPHHLFSHVCWGWKMVSGKLCTFESWPRLQQVPAWVLHKGA